MSQVAQQRVVLELLRGYRDWHSPYGGAAEINLQAMGQFGPAGMITEGMAYEKRYYHRLKTSYEYLDHALILLSNEHMEWWLLLKAPYTGDPGDPSIVEEWRKKRPNLAKHHDKAIEKLAYYLRRKELTAPPRSRMTTRRTVNVKERNDEFYALYQTLRADGLGKTRAVKDAAAMCQYGLTRAWEIVKLRGDSQDSHKAC